jgi:hypothetical protein
MLTSIMNLVPVAQRRQKLGTGRVVSNPIFRHRPQLQVPGPCVIKDASQKNNLKCRLPRYAQLNLDSMLPFDCLRVTSVAIKLNVSNHKHLNT